MILLPRLRCFLLAFVAFFFAVILFAGSSFAKEKVLLPAGPSVSPDGARVAFSWRGDIWTVATKGGKARRLTDHPGNDSYPKYSPDGKKIAFLSDRADGSNQVFVMNASGSDVRQVTFHTEGYLLDGWYPDGQAVLAHGIRDHFWLSPYRLVKVDLTKRTGDQVLFDGYGYWGDVSPDGKKVLFQREGTRWWRKGYTGPRAGQIWIFDAESKAIEKLIGDAEDAKHGCSLQPCWNPDGKGFYYLGNQSGSQNLWYYDFETKKRRQLTQFPDDSVLTPAVSADGSTIVFRHRFDFYVLKPGENKSPEKIKIFAEDDEAPSEKIRRKLDKATGVTFSESGLDVAMIVGGDLWVMDTELCEPHQVTETAENEFNPLFSPDGKTIVFCSDADGQTDIWQATRADEKKPWWENENFVLKRLTNTPEREDALSWSPAGDKIAFVKNKGDLCTMDVVEGNIDTDTLKLIVESWSEVEYDWSPDGKWFAYSKIDADDNCDVWIKPLDGSKEPVNVSCHPRGARNPVWSPDGKIIAFTSTPEGDDESDIFYVYLDRKEDEKTSRDRKLEAAHEKYKKSKESDVLTDFDDDPAAKPQEPKPQEPQKAEPKKVDPKKEEPKKEEPKKEEPKKEEPKKEEPKKEEPKKEEEEKKEEEKSEPIKIDADRIHERVHRIWIKDASEYNLFWSSDSKKLAFTSTINGKKGTYTVEFPDKLSPKLLSSKTGTDIHWAKKGNQITWLSDGVPGTLSATGTAKSYGFRVLHEMVRADYYTYIFDSAWRVMRDRFYDPKMNNRNWDEVRRKYQEAAAKSYNIDSLGDVINMMLGELNASHMGFTPHKHSSTPGDRQWQETTVHLGLRFDPEYKGPGLKVCDVLTDGPTGKEKSQVVAGEIVQSINGTAVDPAMDLTTVLNVPLEKDVELTVLDADGKARDLRVRPITYSAARNLLYEDWIRDCRAKVDELSGGKLGYLHIRAMGWTEFRRFERELYAAGAGKEGLIIDVRYNPGGMIADYLLTAITQPVHAVTILRDGKEGYPQNRKVYATWDKPILVLCNQFSGSNAEIFSHAVKTLKRGKVVGVQTSGSVISTWGMDLLNVGALRIPSRSWFVLGSGEDMERNGAMPDVVVWPKPCEIPAGIDRQLEKGVEVLKEDVKKWNERPRPRLRWASER